MSPECGSPMPDAEVSASPPSTANAPDIAYAKTRVSGTLMPLRYAAARFEPIAYNARPGRRRRIVSQRSAYTASRITSAFGSQAVPTVSTVTRFWYLTGAPPPGTSSTASATPAQTKSMASVTMMSAIRVTWMTKPVSAPARNPNTTSTSETTIARRNVPGVAAEPTAESPRLVTMYFAARTLTSAIIEPTERSMPPEMITIAWPMPTN